MMIETMIAAKRMHFSHNVRMLKYSGNAHTHTRTHIRNMVGNDA